MKKVLKVIKEFLVGAAVLAASCGALLLIVKIDTFLYIWIALCAWLIGGLLLSIFECEL